MKITKLVCPSCVGTGKFRGSSEFVCRWCKGGKRVPVGTALRYADNLWVLAGGGYLAGDHDYDYMRQMENRARDIYHVAQRKPSWTTGA
jgi:hypothetical protein